VDVRYSGPDAARLSVRLTPTQTRKLDAIERATRRSRSDVVRLLIDAAVTDARPQVWLDAGQLEKE